MGSALLLPGAATARPLDVKPDRPGVTKKQHSAKSLSRRAKNRLALEHAFDRTPDTVEFGTKIDPVLAEVAEQVATRPGNPLVRVIVYGSTPSAALSRAGARDIERLTLIGAASGAIDPDRLPLLERDGDVILVVVDSPVQRMDLGTGTVTDSVTTTSSGSTSTSSTSTSTSASAPLGLSFPLLQTLYPTVDGAQAAWDRGLSGRGVGIAVVDSGVTPTADLGGRITQVRLASNGESLNDAYGHGTFVAGITAGKSADGRYVGIAPDANIFALNVARGDAVYTSDVIAGLSWIATNGRLNGIRVVNLSLGETLPSSYKTSPLDAAVEQLWRAGFVVVASAGNAGPDTAQYAPANDPFIISVGATDLNGTVTTTDDVIATFSTYGSTLDGFVKPELVAPGRHIVSTLPVGTAMDQLAPAANHIAPGYVRANGTSFAAPQVAATAALLLQQRPELTPDQVKWLLLTTGAPGVSGTPGFRLNIAGAVSFTGTLGLANVGLEPSAASTAAATGDSGALETAEQKRSRCLERANAWRTIAQQREAALTATSTLLVVKKAAAAWEQAGANYNRAWAWSDAGAAWARAGALWKRHGSLAKAANAYEISGGSYNKAGSIQSSSATWELAAFAYANAATVYQQLGDAVKYEAAAREQREAQFRSATWESATWESATWERSSTWESAAWEDSGDWQSADDSWG